MNGKWRRQIKPSRFRFLAGGVLVLAVILLLLIVRLRQFRLERFISAVLPNLVVNLTNQERVADQLPGLVANSLLTQAAQAKAEDMAARGYFAHQTPEGHSPWYWLEQAGYQYAAAGENLAVNYYQSEMVTAAWMNSPLHRANILRPEFTEIGIGVARGSYGGAPALFVVQYFGRPKR